MFVIKDSFRNRAVPAALVATMGFFSGAASSSAQEAPVASSFTQTLYGDIVTPDTKCEGFHPEQLNGSAYCVLAVSQLTRAYQKASAQYLKDMEAKARESANALRMSQVETRKVDADLKGAKASLNAANAEAAQLAVQRQEIAARMKAVSERETAKVCFDQLKAYKKIVDPDTYSSFSAGITREALCDYAAKIPSGISPPPAERSKADSFGQ